MKLSFNPIVKVLIITAIVSLSIFLIKEANDLKKANRIWQENLYQIINEKNQQILLENEKQFKKIYPFFDSIAKEMNVKNITQVYNTYYSYVQDTFILPLIPDKNDSILNFDKDTNCISISGSVFLDSKMIKFDHIKLNEKITTFYYQDRQRLFNIKWFPKWGKKSMHSKTHSNCSDSIKTENILINKL